MSSEGFIVNKRKSAMKKALLVMREAWRQGSAKEPLSGEAKMLSDMHTREWMKTDRGITGVTGYFPNIILEKYQRGAEGLPYLAYSGEAQAAGQ